MPRGAKEPEFRYWDACCLTSYLNADPPERMPHLEGVLEEVRASNGGLFLLTSTVSIVEVAFSIEEKLHRALLAAEEERIDKMLSDTATIRLVEPHEVIMRLARGFIRQAMTSTEKLSLKAADAIHLATAKQMAATEFNTYDGKLLNPEYQRITGLTIRKPTAAMPALPLFGAAPGA